MKQVEKPKLKTGGCYTSGVTRLAKTGFATVGDGTGFSIGISTGSYAKGFAALLLTQQRHGCPIASRVAFLVGTGFTVLGHQRRGRWRHV